MQQHLPEWRYGVPEGGLSLWVTLPVPVSSALAATAERFGVRVAAMSRFAAKCLLECHLRVPFTLPEADLRGAIVRLGQAYVELTVWVGGSTALAQAETTVL